jgi:hypothetical protein
MAGVSIADCLSGGVHPTFAVPKLCPNSIYFNHWGLLFERKQIPQIVVIVRIQRKMMEPLEPIPIPTRQVLDSKSREKRQIAPALAWVVGCQSKWKWRVLIAKATARFCVTHCGDSRRDYYQYPMVVSLFLTASYTRPIPATTQRREEQNGPPSRFSCFRDPAFSKLAFLFLEADHRTAD